MNDSRTHEKRVRTARAAAILAACLFLLPLASAVRAEEALPEAGKILDKYVKATGGVKAYDKIENRVIKGTLELAGQGITLEMTLYQAKPQLSYTLVESDVTGKIEKGTSDGVAWENSMMSGPRIPEGEERDLMLLGATMDAMVYWRDNYEKVETAGVETVGDQETYKVVITPKLGPEQSVFFDKENGLVVKVMTTIDSPMGKVPLETYAKDYRKVDGILLSFAAEIDIMGGKRLMTMNSIEHNVDLPPGTFDLPEPIKALLNKDAATE